jgi:hypothetical protein
MEAECDAVPECRKTDFKRGCRSAIVEISRAHPCLPDYRLTGFALGQKPAAKVGMAHVDNLI